MILPLQPVRGRISGEFMLSIPCRSDRPCVDVSRSYPRRVAGAPPPCRSFASLPNAPLDAAFSQIHRRGQGAPGRDQGHHPSGSSPATGRGGRGPFTPLRCHGSCEGSQAVTNPRRGCASLHLPPLDAAWSQGLVTAHSRSPRQRSSPPGRRRLGFASLRLCLGAEPWACGSHVAPSGEGGVSLVRVEAVASREPHRRQVRWGSPRRLSRFWGIEPASPQCEAPPARSPRHERSAYAYRTT